MLESWFGENNDNKSAGVTRAPEAQAEVDRATEKLALYYYQTCWFCGTVRSTIDRLKLNIELRDIHGGDGHHQQLISDGGSGTVPCLLIEDDKAGQEWLYESRDISAYLERRFGEAS